MDDLIEPVAVAIEATMFALHELPLERELHEKYRWTARAAITAYRIARKELALEAEAGRLRTIEEHAGLMRDGIESLSVGHAMNAETVRGALRLIVKAYDENVS